PLLDVAGELLERAAEGAIGRYAVACEDFGNRHGRGAAALRRIGTVRLAQPARPQEAQGILSLPMREGLVPLGVADHDSLTTIRKHIQVRRHLEAEIL